MTDPILYLSIFLSLAGIYTLISSFGDDDDDNDGDGEILIYNYECLVRLVVVKVVIKTCKILL